MKKTLLIIGGVALVFILLIVRLFVVERNDVVSEQEWFVKEVAYEFSAEVDSIRLYNSAGGLLRGRITAGVPQTHREDSLKKYFKKHEMMYLVFKRSGDTIRFILPYANRVKKGDSIRISSKENMIRVFREGKEITHEPMSESLTAYQGAPFVK